LGIEINLKLFFEMYLPLSKRGGISILYATLYNTNRWLQLKIWILCSE